MLVLDRKPKPATRRSSLATEEAELERNTCTTPSTSTTQETHAHTEMSKVRNPHPYLILRSHGTRYSGPRPLHAESLELTTVSVHPDVSKPSLLPSPFSLLPSSLLSLLAAHFANRFHSLFPPINHNHDQRCAPHHTTKKGKKEEEQNRRAKQRKQKKNHTHVPQDSPPRAAAASADPPPQHGPQTPDSPYLPAPAPAAVATTTTAGNSAASVAAGAIPAPDLHNKQTNKQTNPASAHTVL
ncbi:hypothetical protein EVG20_g10315 [Dentipellis fragilis]|uniref:Uncharacterized protein n=1 Tax=Dentipellis fragilis TaxID=205917 RepID=A0A4Y9XU83_9AGAM|nr:hypothetical protein EVG20_g10315 [Dentipellis fragilis]